MSSRVKSSKIERHNDAKSQLEEEFKTFRPLKSYQYLHQKLMTSVLTLDNRCECRAIAGMPRRHQ